MANFENKNWGVGYLDLTGCMALGVTGPCLRSTGLPHDLRRAQPYCWYEDYEFDGRTVWLTLWHRPLHAMADAFAQAGFTITGISEPPAAPDTPADVLPPGLAPGQRFIGFLFFQLVAA